MLFRRISAALIIALSFPVLLWLISFQFLAGYLCLISFIIAIILVFRSKPFRILLYYVLFFCFINSIFFLNSLDTYNSRRVEMFRKINKGNDLVFFEKFSIYGLNLAMSIIGYPFFPEVSKETFLLSFETKDQKRTFNSDFFMNSQKVQSAIQFYKPKQTNEIKWKVSEYVLGNKEARFALALNPCTLKVENQKYALQVHIKYPPSCEVVLLSKPRKIIVEEGLFHYLQVVGWLHPYQATWIYEGGQ